jgi:hypothetical protein
MQEDIGHITWRVDALDEAAGVHTFDARVVVHDQRMPARDAGPDTIRQLMREMAQTLRDGGHFQRAVPFECSMPNTPLTLVVSPHGDSPPVKVSFAAFDAAGTPLVSGWSDSRCTVIVHTATGTAFTSLPESEPAPWPVDDAVER